MRTAQQAQPFRLTRMRICRAWSRDRAIPNTVGPLPDMIAPSAPAAKRAAFMRPITGSTGTSIILMDAFEREDSSNVGGIWGETDPSNVVAIDSGALRLSSNADRFGYIRTPAGTNQLGVMISFTSNVGVLNSGQVLQVGTKAGGGADNVA